MPLPTQHPQDLRQNQWVVTCETWEADGYFITLPINPTSLRVSRALRVGSGTSLAGKYQSIGRNYRTKSALDSFQLSFAFHSSYVIPMYDSEAIPRGTPDMPDLPALVGFPNSSYPRANETTARYNYATGVFTDYQKRNYDPHAVGLASPPRLYHPDIPIGVQNLYALLALVNAPKTRRVESTIFPGGYDIVPNRIKVTANTPAFPLIVFYGMFDEKGVSWGESAEEPGGFTTTVNLRVTTTYPRMGFEQLSNMVNNYVVNQKTLTTYYATENGVANEAQAYKKRVQEAQAEAAAYARRGNR